MGAPKGAKPGKETIHKIILNIVLSCQGKKAICLASHNPTPCRYSSTPCSGNSHQSVQKTGFKRKEPHTGSDPIAYGLCQRAVARVLLVDKCTLQPRKQKRMEKKRRRGRPFHISLPHQLYRKQLVCPPPKDFP